MPSHCILKGSLSSRVVLVLHFVPVAMPIKECVPRGGVGHTFDSPKASSGWPPALFILCADISDTNCFHLLNLVSQGDLGPFCKEGLFLELSQST